MPQFCSSALQRKSGVKYSDFGFQPKFNFSDVKMKWLIQNLALKHWTGSLWLIWCIHLNPWGNGQSLPWLCHPLETLPAVCARSQGILESPFFTYRGKREAESSPAELWRALHWALVQNCLAIPPKDSLSRVIHEANLQVQEINLLCVQGSAGITDVQKRPRGEILEYKMISSSLSIQVICLLEKPFTHFSHPESSDSSNARKGFIRKKRFARQCWSERGKMHLTFNTATVESICPQRSKAQTLRSTAQVLTSPALQWDGRETDTPWLKRGSCCLNCPAEHWDNIGSCVDRKKKWRNHRKNQDWAFQCQRWRSKKHPPATATLLPAELTPRDRF